MILRRKAWFDITPVPPFDFKLTVRKPAGWDFLTSKEVFEGRTMWTGMRFRGRPVGLKIESRGTVKHPRVLVGAYADGGISDRDADELKKTLAVCLGAEQDLRDFYDFASNDEILKHAVRDLYGMHDTQGASLFSSVSLSICLQMARLKRSMEMTNEIDKKYGETIEFDGKRIVLQPSAERIAGLDPKAFAKECKLGYRAKYIVGAAKMIEKGFPDIQEIMKMPAEEAKEKLTELPGVGDYAADIINPHGGFPIDAWSVDVFGLLFFGQQPKERREAIESVKQEGIRRWGKWSWMAFFYVAQDLENLSKRLGLRLRLE